MARTNEGVRAAVLALVLVVSAVAGGVLAGAAGAAPDTTGVSSSEAASSSEATSSSDAVVPSSYTVPREGAARGASTARASSADPSKNRSDGGDNSSGARPQVYVECDGSYEFCHVLGATQEEGSLRIVVVNGLPETRRYRDGEWVRQFYTFGGLALRVGDRMLRLGYYNGESSQNGITDPTGGWGSGAYHPPVDQYRSGDSVVTVWEVDGIRVTQTITYESASDQFYRFEWNVTNIGDSAHGDVHLFRGVDTYLANGDFGNGFWNGETNTVGVRKTVDGVQEQLVFQGVTDPVGYRSAFYATVIEDVNSGSLENSATTEFHDNGYALEWTHERLDPGESWHVTAYESFGASTLSVDNAGSTQLDGDTATLTFTVQNVGSSDRTVDYSVNCPADFDCRLNTTSETISAGGTSTVAVTVDPPSGQAAGTYSVSLSADAEGVRTAQGVGQVVIPERAAVFSVEQFVVPSSHGVDSLMSVTATVTNTGAESGTQTVTLTLDGEPIATREITLPPGRTKVVATTVDPPSTGTHSVGVSTANETRTATIEFVAGNFRCGVVTGDPHLGTFDGLGYDFQAAGEFVLVRSGGDRPFTVQTRTVPVGESVSTATALATELGGTSVVIDAQDATPLTVGGERVNLADGESVQVGSGLVRRSGNTYTVVFPGPDGEPEAGDEHVSATLWSDRMDIRVCLLEDRSAPVEGLLGDADGDPGNDIALADGTVLSSDPSFETLYGSFRSSWLVEDTSESLFTYEDGRGPDSYYMPDFPREEVTVDDLPENARERARERASEAGLEPGTRAFRNAIIDFALTNESSYLASARSSADEFVPGEAGYTVEFADGLAGWTVGLNESWVRDRVDPGTGSWSSAYGGSVRLHVDGGPSHVGVYRRVDGLEAGTRIVANYETSTLEGEPGGPRLLLHLPNGTTHSLDMDTGGGGSHPSEHNGTLVGTVPSEMPPGTYLEVRLGVWPGEITVHVTNVTIGQALPAAHAHTVTLRPEEPNVSVGGTVTLDLVFTNATAGVGAHNFINVSVGNTDVATVTAVSSEVASSGTVRVADDGSRGAVRVGFGGDTPDTGTVTVATVTLRGQSVGSTSLSVTVTGDVAKESGLLYGDVAARSTTLRVVETGPPALPGFANAPTNVDDDGQYEDVNGNGRFDIGDVQALFANRNTDAVQNNVDAFDFNDNGRIDIGDIQSLFVEYTRR